MLTPLALPAREGVDDTGAKALFAVVDRIGGAGDNLEEYALDPPVRVADRHGLLR